MANYHCTIRTNYFHVKDEEAFRELMSRAYGSEDNLQLFESADKNGKTVFGFGVYGGIAGVRNADADEDDDVDDTAYDEFIAELQKCIADDGAIIILESGNEKLRYIVGSATIITSNDHSYLNITSIASKNAAKMLNNPEWQTKCEY